MTEKYEFLSPEWEAAADAIVGSAQAVADADVTFTMNLTIAPTPFGDKLIYLKASGTDVELGKQHLETADVTVKSDYDTARTLFLGGEMSIVMTAMMTGKVVIQGNMAKLMALSPTPGAIPSIPFLESLGEKLKEITL